MTITTAARSASRSGPNRASTPSQKGHLLNDSRVRVFFREIGEDVERETQKYVRIVEPQTVDERELFLFYEPEYVEVVWR